MAGPSNYDGAITIGGGTLNLAPGSGLTATYSGSIGGGGSLVKSNAGTVILSTANTYTGTTTVNGGTLDVTGTLANNGSDKMFIAANGTSFGATLTRTIASGANAYAGYGSTITSDLQSAAQLLYGSSTGSHDLSMQWRERTQGEKNGSILSDILQLGGMATSGQTTDPFVLEMTCGANLLSTVPYLASFENGIWQRATFDDIGSTNDHFAGLEAWSGDTNLGDWGFNPVGHEVWAVLNYNGNFAAVPEPSSIILLGIGVISLLAYAWRRRRRAAY